MIQLFKVKVRMVRTGIVNVQCESLEEAHKIVNRRPCPVSINLVGSEIEAWDIIEEDPKDKVNYEL